jgi:transketolase
MPFELGKAQVLSEGKDVTLVACGHLVWKSLLAAEQLEANGISVEVINLHTIKPLDTQTILNSVAKTNCLVSAEEHNIFGGMGDLLAGVISRNNPVAMEMVAVNDSFGESGTPEELMVKYGLDTPDIIRAIEKVLNRKAQTK